MFKRVGAGLQEKFSPGTARPGRRLRRSEVEQCHKYSQGGRAAGLIGRVGAMRPCLVPLCSSLVPQLCLTHMIWLSEVQQRTVQLVWSVCHFYPRLHLNTLYSIQERTAQFIAVNGDHALQMLLQKQVQSAK